MSGQFNERVEPLGEEPVVTLTLWLPARCTIDASIKSRAAGRMWLKSLQVAGRLVFLLLWLLLLVLKLLLSHGVGRHDQQLNTKGRQGTHAKIPAVA